LDETTSGRSNIAMSVSTARDDRLSVNSYGW
jgi:hypothetical protein